MTEKNTEELENMEQHQVIRAMVEELCYRPSKAIAIKKELLQKKRDALLQMIDESLFIYDEEKAFFKALRDSPFPKYVNEHSYMKAVNELAILGEMVNLFLDKCNIIKDEPNVEKNKAEKIKRNRTTLLQIFKDDCVRIADFSKLQG